jgi:RNA polymerase primary sigma factor
LDFPPRPSSPRHASRPAPDTRQHPRDARLSAAEECALAEAVARGDADARDRFIRANLGLVRIIAPLYRDMGLDLDDLIGEGHLGLIRAVERFDPAVGVRFSTFAACCIKTAIRDALTRTASTVRLPAHIVRLLAKWRQVERHLCREFGFAPTAEQVAVTLGLTASQREMIEQARRARGMRMEADGGDDDGAWSPDELADGHAGAGDSLEADDERRALRRRLEELDERERAVVVLWFGLEGEAPLTSREIGRRVGLTGKWVRELVTRAIRKLGHSTPAGAPSPAQKFA